MGFEVVGVDSEPQPHYPGRFVRGDALHYPVEDYDLVWASPPCQAFTAYRRRPDYVGPAENLIPRIRDRLVASGIPYVIENVPGAPLVEPVTLCGSMFGLDVRRHRILETSFPLDPIPPCSHAWPTPRFAQATNRDNRRSTVEVGVWRIPLEVQQAAMGIHWLDLEALSQAVPPAYSEFIGRRFVLWRSF